MKSFWAIEKFIWKLTQFMQVNMNLQHGITVITQISKSRNLTLSLPDIQFQKWYQSFKLLYLFLSYLSISDQNLIFYS